MPARMLAALALLGALAGCAAPLPPEVIQIRSAARVEIAADDRAAALTPPSAARFAAAPRVSLPDLWFADRRSRAHDGWYRAAFELGDAPRVGWAIYLPHLEMNVAVLVNGEKIGDGGPFEPRLARNYYRPLLFPIPRGLLHAGENVLEIRLGIEPTALGVLGQILVGPDGDLRPAYDRQLLGQVRFVELAIVLILCFSLAALRLWVGRHHLPGFAESAVACLLWALAMLDLVVRVPPMPARLWQWLGTSALAGSATLLVIAAHRHLELGRARLERGVVAVWLGGAIAFAAALLGGSPRVVDAVVLAWALATFAVGIYLLWLLVLVRRAASSLSIRFVAPLGMLGFVAAAHDLASAFGEPVEPSFLVFPALGSLVAVWGGIRLLERFGQALSESEQLNRELEQRVQERGHEIARNYERIGLLEREQVVERERQRLMGDIHDGLGSQLSSTLALVESADVPRDEVADALRDALDDMRLLIASLAPGDEDVIGLLARWRGRIERRLERRDLHFAWQVSELPPLPWLGPRESLNVLRIFQEAVSNVAQHAGASTITVRTAVRADASGAAGVSIEIRDDGCGLHGGWGAANDSDADAATAGGPQNATSAGFGVRNMKRRATELGGRLAVADAHPGTSVVLWLPLARDGDAGSDGDAT